MKSRLIPGLLACLLAVGCSSAKPTFVGFTLGGKSYSTASARLTLEAQQLLLEGDGPEVTVQLVATGVDGEVVGKTLPVTRGDLKIGQATHKVQSGELTVQTLDGLARGNFDLVVEPDLKVVGSFDAAR